MLTFYIIIIIYFLFCVQPATGKIYVFDHFPAVVSSIVHTLCDYTTKYNTLTSLYFHNPVNSCQLLLLIPAISARNRNKNGVVIGCSTFTNACTTYPIMPARSGIHKGFSFTSFTPFTMDVMISPRYVIRPTIPIVTRYCRYSLCALS